jgi:hypothetical protein
LIITPSTSQRSQSTTLRSPSSSTCSFTTRKSAASSTPSRQKSC